jgi:hypothetical protein
VHQPSNGVPGVTGDVGVELPDESAPDPDLRAARNELRAVGASIRDALAADDLLAAGGRRGSAGDETDGVVK